jgi:hypothetical protein
VTVSYDAGMMRGNGLWLFEDTSMPSVFPAVRKTAKNQAQ